MAGRGWPWLLWALLWLGLGTSLYLLRDSERHTTVANETSQLLTQSQIAARVLEMEIEAADHALDMLLAGLPVWQQHPHNQQRATEHLQRVLDVLLGTRSFTVLDGNGVVQLSTVPTLVGGNYAHWPFFQEIAQTVHHNIARVFISRPYLTSNNTWAVNVSRAMLNDGQLRGVVVATLDPTFFRDLMNELRYTDDMVVGLVHDSGQPYVASAHPSISTADMLQHLAEAYAEQSVSSTNVSIHPEHLHVSSNIRPNGTGSILKIVENDTTVWLLIDTNANGIMDTRDRGAGNAGGVNDRYDTLIKVTGTAPQGQTLTDLITGESFITE